MLDTVGTEGDHFRSAGCVPPESWMRCDANDGLRGNRFRPVRQILMESVSTGRVYGLRVGGRRRALGIPITPPRFAWSVGSSAGERISGFEVRVAEREDQLADGPTVWSTVTQRPSAPYDGPELRSRQRRYWRVSARDVTGAEIAGEAGWFEAGLADPGDWTASWIAAPRRRFARESWDPAPHLRQVFQVDDWECPRLYITALGLYRVWLNGVELTASARLRPGWTDYRRRVLHQTYDCEGVLRRGRNVIAIVLAKGWYAGRVGLLREPGLYGDRPAVLAQLESRPGAPVMITDASFSAGFGAIQATDLLRGEVQDLRQEPSGWREVDFDADGWVPVEVVEVPDDLVITPQPHDSISPHREFPGRLVRAHARGPAVYDFGQNLVGWTRLETSCLPSVDLIVRHGEILTAEKLVYRDNLRGAFQTDTFTVPDAGPHVLEPMFGFHGFRYAEVWGLPSLVPFGNQEVLPDTTITAVALTGLAGAAGEFRSSDDRLNRLASAVEYTVRDNFLEVATDCPQRDERAGWLGDAGVIAPTAAYFFDLEAFLVKFTQDIADGQRSDGAIRDYIPVLPGAELRPGAPGWSDGYVRLVHLLATRYGALEVADRLFGSMWDYLAFVDRANPDGLRVNEVGADFGDWLSLPDREGLVFHRGFEYTGAFSTSAHPVVDTAHTYRSFVQLAEIASWLGRSAARETLAARAEAIRQAYLRAFVAPDGTISGDTQTAYAQAIGFGLVEGDGARLAADHLRRLIDATGHPTTGIHGVQHLLPALVATGHQDDADRLLFRDTMPSWLYMIGAGATTIWEKWDGIRPDGTLSTAEMNSFNHCALGAVGQFLFENVGGVRASTVGRTGRLTVGSHYPAQLDWAEVRHESPAGLVASRWTRTNGRVEHGIEVPGAVAAEFVAPAGCAILSIASASAADRPGALDRPDPVGPPGASGATAVLGPGRHVVTIEDPHAP
jgi:alpha-L-rhamnosidase